MTAEERAAWWQETGSRIDQALAHYIDQTGEKPYATVCELMAWCVLQRDKPAIRCGHCGEDIGYSVREALQHDCEAGKSRADATQD